MEVLDYDITCDGRGFLGKHGGGTEPTGGLISEDFLEEVIGEQTLTG